MVMPYENPRNKDTMQKAISGEVIVFRAQQVCATVTDMELLINDNSLCDRIELKDNTLFIPTVSLDALLCGVIAMLGDIVENSENLRPMLRNFILTEIVDSSPVGAVSSVVSESAQTIIDACEVLVKQLLDVYDWTHSRTDGRHGYELLRVTSTGALIVCRFSLDY